MNFSPSAIKRTLSMLGIDLTSIAEQAGPLIQDELDKQLQGITLQDGERAGFTLYANNGQYYSRKVAIATNGQLRPVEAAKPLNNTIQTIINILLHAN